jgi:hypothetical protein
VRLWLWWWNRGSAVDKQLSRFSTSTVSYRNVPYSIFFCVEVISSTLMLRKQRNTPRFATIRLKWKTGFMQTSKAPTRSRTSVYVLCYVGFLCLPSPSPTTSLYLSKNQFSRQSLWKHEKLNKIVNRCRKVLHMEISSVNFIDDWMAYYLWTKFWSRQV